MSYLNKVASSITDLEHLLVLLNIGSFEVHGTYFKIYIEKYCKTSIKE